MTLVATHYPELKVWAHTTPGAINASVEFDPETLRPTYKLTIGLPGRSNAFAIATRLGLTADIVTHAKSMVAEGDLKVEDLLAEIHQQKEAIAQSREIADRARREAETTARQLRERLNKIEDERADILEAAREDAQAQVELLREEIDRLRKKLCGCAEDRKSRGCRRDRSRDRATGRTGRSHRARPDADRETGAGLAPQAARGRHRLCRADQLDGGSHRDRSRPDRSRRGFAAHEGQARRSGMARRRRTRGRATGGRPAASVHLTSQARMEIDLRGLRVDDGLDELERQLDAAYLNGMPFVRIIHGKGTGAMKKAVREALHTNPHVKRFEGGKDEEGGEGVTIAFMLSDL